MTYAPVHLEKWTRPDSYFGASWPEYYSAYGQHRDSDTLTRSNFTCMLNALGGESDSVLVVRENHWAVGWVEWVAIHESNENALKIADDICAQLENYPVINEDHLSELENEEAQEVWSNCYNTKERIEYIRANHTQFDFYDYADLIAVCRGRYFNGYASELIQ